MFDIRRGHALRNGRVSIPGQAYLVTSVTRDRSRLFADFPIACLACRTLVQPALWTDATLSAWVLMPDHLHLVLELGAGSTLAMVVQRLKAVISMEVGRVLGSSGIWQRGYHDHALRTDEALRDVGRYVIANPLRAGLVDRVENYPFWDACWLEPGANPLDP